MRRSGLVFASGAYQICGAHCEDGRRRICWVNAMDKEVDGQEDEEGRVCGGGDEACERTRSARNVVRNEAFGETREGVEENWGG